MSTTLNRNTFLVALLVAISGCLLVNCQFLPQSHLGRLVQSITSPLVLSSGNSYGGESESEPSSGYYPAEPSSASARPDSTSGSFSGGNSQGSGLQQAPSQQRGVPTQHYYSGHEEERDQGSAPSNNKHTQDYQMGAYLGPSMDDKEINGVFNSNDDRDEDEGPASYEGPSTGGRTNAAATNNYHNNNGLGGEGYGPNYGRSHQMAAGGYEAPSSSYGNPNYDEDGADEDDGPASSPMRGRRGGQRNPNAGYGRSGLSQAASQYQQQGSYGNSGNQAPMMAANSAGFGYGGGPMDLQGLMAGDNIDPSSGYQVYNGDGSYPGANYYQQQAQRGNRNNQQAASGVNGYYNNQNQLGPNSRAPHEGSRNENDEHDNEADED